MQPYRLAGIRIPLLGAIPFVLALAFSQTPVVAWDQQESPPDRASILNEIQDLKKRLEALEKELLEQKQKEEPEAAPVDLSEQEGPYFSTDRESHVLAREWYHNIDISGFGAVGYLDSGDDGTRPHGGFLIKESTLFVEATAWQNMSFFFELQVNRLGRDGRVDVRTGEVYANFHNLLGDWGNDLLGIKVGRVDIPFGEEYLWQDSSDNPLISNSAPYPYGYDEGVVAYGTLKGLGWITAVTDGTDARSIEDHGDKAFNFKAFGSPLDSLYLSASFMRNGRAGKSAFEFGGSHFQPVGASDVSRAGNSPNQQVNANLFELDAKYSFGEKAYVSGSFGQAFVDDEDSAFDRDFTWFSLEPLYWITPRVYAVARYSEIGTYDAGRGYHFDGKTTAGGNASFGYDTRRFQRLSAGLGWRPNQRVIIKFEVGHDWFEVIDDSLLTPDDDARLLYGGELVLVF